MDFNKTLRLKPKSTLTLHNKHAANTPGITDKRQAETLLEKSTLRLQDLQYLLYAENKHALLVVLQAMDGGGKDGVVRHVLGPLNPQGCRVTSFKAPNAEELAHDFLWRIHKAVPVRGEIGVFNRSHYEDVLVVRVHDLVPRVEWEKRYDQINQFEKTLTENGVTIVKFFLHISKDEQLVRLRARLDDPKKIWKSNPQDFQERKRWKEYMQAYQDALTRCSTPWAPWHIIPSDRKWYRNLAVSEILVQTLKNLKMSFPPPQFNPKDLVIE